MAVFRNSDGSAAVNSQFHIVHTYASLSLQRRTLELSSKGGFSKLPKTTAFATPPLVHPYLILVYQFSLFSWWKEQLNEDKYAPGLLKA